MVLCHRGLRIFSTIHKAFKSSKSAASLKHHRILIVGGGSAGCGMASRLRRRLGPNQIAVIEPSSVHYYQPLWTLVGAGILPFSESMKPTSEVIPNGTELIKDRVEKFEPDNSLVVLSNESKVSYDYLILALGIKLRYDKIKGAEEALNTDDRVCSNYSPQYVEKTFRAYKSFKFGEAIFTLPFGPIKCAGAPLKVMYLFEDYIRRHGIRDKAEINYFTALEKLFSVSKYSKYLTEICDKRQIHYNLLHNLVEVNAKKSEVVFEHIERKTRRCLKYDFLHITPPMCVPDVLKSTPNFTDPSISEYVNVDPKTLRVKHYQNIFALGDCAAIPTSKTAAAASVQCRIVEENLMQLLNGNNECTSEYDGYTACPIVTGYRTAIIAEFDYNLEPRETFPINQGKERYLFYIIKTYMLPFIYWRFFVKGLWAGPTFMRKLLHLRMIR